MSEQQHTGQSGGVHVSRIVLVGLGLAILAAVAMMAAAFGYRLGLWSYRFALLTLTEYAAYAAFAGGAISLVGFGRSLPSGWAGMVLSVIGVIVGCYSGHTIYQQWVTVKSVPFIHDITTDTDNPPGQKTSSIGLPTGAAPAGGGSLLVAGLGWPGRRRLSAPQWQRLPGAARVNAR